MKKVLFVIAVLAGSLAGKAQLMQGSIRPGSQLNQADIMFSPSQAPGGTEYVNYLSISIAIPEASAATVVPTISVAGTPFLNMVLQPAVPFFYTQGSERIYSWIALNLTNSTPSVWTGGTPFRGATVSFAGGTSSQQVRLVDFTNVGGGFNGNTNFFVITNLNDWTDYTDFFYAIPGPTSTVGTYGNGDHYAQTVGLVALPIDLLTFSGYKDGIRNQLRWTTSIETNNKGFEMQRSSDGVNYSTIAFVNSLAAGGYSSSPLNYSYTDNNVQGNRNFYRLRQVDYDGRSKLSDIVLIKGDKPAFITIDGMFPNPATTTLNLMVGSPAKDKVSLVVTDLSGKNVMQRSLNVETGSNTLPVNVSALASGTYIVRLISSDGEVTTGKFVKQ